MWEFSVRTFSTIPLYLQLLQGVNSEPEFPPFGGEASRMYRSK
jgi:hypothetical protein